MTKAEFNWKIAGYAGQGIMTTGLLLSKTCARHGLSAFDYTEYPSLIRGGHNTIQVKASKDKTNVQEKLVDLLIALNPDGVKLHLAEISEGTTIIFDQKESHFTPQQFQAKGIHYDIPMADITRQVGADKVMVNNVALGVSLYLLGLDLETFHNVLISVFKRKGDDVIKANQDAAAAGYAFAKEHSKPIETISLQKGEDRGEIVLSGNEAVGLGAISSGCKYFAAYPMTPTSALLHYMASVAEKYAIVVKHAEDEISAINQIIGASYAGVRSMTATSGGGFALMVEGVSLAGMTETPIVILEGQRPAPATGLPTWTSQADLQFVLRSGHGEFPRAILTPGDVEEAFSLTRLAFEIAEKYQTPVIILGDKQLLESHQSCAPFAKTFSNERFGFANQEEKGTTFLRYKDTDTGVSPRALPGDADALFLANSYEHNEYGLATEESDMTAKQVSKRLRKEKGIASLIPKPTVFGPSDAELTFISWGSNKGAILSALKKLEGDKRTFNFMHLSAVWPFPIQEVTGFIRTAKRPVLVECNATGQLGQLLRQETGIVIDERLLKYDGRPFFPEEIADYARRTT
ncbi:MAG: hypothetical protein A2900_04115 [Candidatus Chisholmbacteria bacterium RIFCSPLOWO2_01_FULL_50_28]|uniref:2-oxoacid:ferredoxin oxidoreductase subunit alpha n=1 Tax=Candidatus Chisholmbacteria bacterium RIFCSPHIGHO2_01_FULL_52_32 TaxID=1797591 RepID=A0A1G1VSS3_9BACT|nr:MAG: hypothetical protein A2786_02630 [Candidatus Chisholmbacteria bacterium RIFCSPHIGHO2_01_FULL_52_32]OGY20255.1 MAG: hypothetical protein A2900_04115 [Candidatus Chisholmbacteria bacterium RIFCSPLOWO2_01_FULL_50_28]